MTQKKILTIRDIDTDKLSLVFQGDWTEEEKFNARQKHPEIKDLPEKIILVKKKLASQGDREH